MSSSAGTKVTNDPQALNNPKNENPGTVTSDSLAGESVQGGGSFGANSDARGPSGQPSSSTTTNNTDTSGATTLDAAPSAGLRGSDNSSGSLSSNSKDYGVTSTGSSSDSSTGGSSGTSSGSYSGAVSGGSSGNSENTAPGYVSNPAPSMGGSDKPHGKSIQEGGLPDDAPNASFNQDIGGENDPGRAALGGASASNAPVAGGAGPRESGLSGAQTFSGDMETSA